LTGDIQIGKTRWLEGVLDELAQDGVVAYGVIAPGRWVERTGSFEKTGIDNVLLPQGERVAFAEPGNPGWSFSRQAIDRVNCHLSELSDLKEATNESASVAGTFPAPTGLAEMNGMNRVAANELQGNSEILLPSPGLLVIDELGWLELQQGRGLTEAMKLLDAGASRLFPHAVVVVREALLPLALERFNAADWDDMDALSPNDESRGRLKACFPS
jgi:nucleoside-triphosphatase THEP1